MIATTYPEIDTHPRPWYRLSVRCQIGNQPINNLGLPKNT